MHTDSGMTGISLSGYMPYMTVASLEMSDEPKILKNHTFRYYTMICNYLIINYMYNKNHIPILYTEVLCVSI